jgi:LysM repeat protein
MNPDLLSATVSMVFMGVVCAALLAHLTRIAQPPRFPHGVQAVTAAGLLYFFGEKALSWRLLPSEALCGLYVALFLIVAILAFTRPGGAADGEIPWRGLLIEQAAMAYVFAPAAYWKAAVSGLFMLYFLFEFFSWLSGREEAAKAVGAEKDHRPPLFAPKRVRGVREFALAGIAAALVYVFAMGTSRLPASPPLQEQASVEPPAEPSASGEATAPGEGQAEERAEAPSAESPAPEPPAPKAEASSAPVDRYTAAAGDTLKSIAKKLYGAPEKWRDLAKANPGLKPGAKLKAGVVVKLPAPPTK